MSGDEHLFLGIDEPGYFVFDARTNRMECRFPATRAGVIRRPSAPSETHSFGRHETAGMAMLGTRLFVVGSIGQEDNSPWVVASVETSGADAWSGWEVGFELDKLQYDHPHIWADARAPDRVSVLWASRSGDAEALYVEIDADGTIVWGPGSSFERFGLDGQIVSVLSSLSGWMVVRTEEGRLYRRSPNQEQFELVHGSALPNTRAHLLALPDARLFQVGPGAMVYQLEISPGEACPTVTREARQPLAGLDEVTALSPATEGGRVLAGVARGSLVGAGWIDLEGGEFEWMIPLGEGAPWVQIVPAGQHGWAALDALGSAYLLDGPVPRALRPADFDKDAPRAIRSIASRGSLLYLGGRELFFRALPGRDGSVRAGPNLLPTFASEAWTSLPRNERPRINGLRTACTDQVQFTTEEGLTGSGSGAVGLRVEHRGWTTFGLPGPGDPELWAHFDVNSRGMPMGHEDPAGIVGPPNRPVFVYSGRPASNATVYAFGSDRTVLPFRDPSSVVEHEGHIFIAGPGGRLASVRALPR